IPSNRDMRTLRERLEKKYLETGDHIDKIALDYVKFAQATGSRSFNGLGTTTKHIRKNPDGTLTVTHYKDKGSLTRQVTIYDETKIKNVLELKEAAKGGKLFQAFKEDKKFMSNKTLQKRVDDKIKEITED